MKQNPFSFPPKGFRGYRGGHRLSAKALRRWRENAMQFITANLQGEDLQKFLRLGCLMIAGVVALSIDQLIGAGMGLLAFNIVIPPGYKPSEEALTRVEWWHGTIAQKIDNIHNLNAKFQADGVIWGAETEMITHIKNSDTLISALETKCATSAASKDDFNARNQRLAEIVYYCRNNVRSFCISKCAAGVIEIGDLNSMGFLMPGQMAQNHKRSPIPTEILTLKLIQKVIDQVNVIFERNSGIDSEEGRGGAWAKWADGAVLAYKLDEESNSLWRYEYFVKIHNLLVLPAEWRGKKINFKAAYFGHADDPRDQLPWCEVQTIVLHHSSADKDETTNNE